MTRRLRSNFPPAFKSKGIFAAASLFISILSASAVQSAELFIDYENGSDRNHGTTKAQAWKHAPGDSQATSKAKAYEVKAGDTIIFKGGVRYYGNIVVPQDGNPSAPVTYRGDAWGGNKAIIDGAVSIELKFSRCSSAIDCSNNKNWRHLVVAEIAEPIDPFAPLFIANERYWPAQSPNMPDPFWFDDLKSYFRVPKNSQIIQLSSDSLRLDKDSFLSRESDWGDAWISAWLKPNKIIVAQVTKIDPINQTVYFHKQKHKPYLKRDSYYSFFNRPVDVDRAGEYSVEYGKRKFLLWPYDASLSGRARIHVATLPRAFDLNGRSNVEVSGFLIRNFYGRLKEWKHGTAIINTKKTSKNILIRNNHIENLRSAVGVGAIQLRNTKNVRIEQNTIVNAQKNSGIRVSRSTEVSIAKNRISRIGRTGIRLIDNHRVQVTDNHLSEILGVHGNGISVYLKNTDILVANNFISNTPSAFTYHGSRKADDARNLWVLNNIFLGRVNSWGKNMSRISFIHNLFLDPDTPGKAFRIPDSDRKVVAINNILDGWLVKKYPMDWTVLNNVYSALSIFQKSRYRWDLEPGGEVNRRLQPQIMSAISKGGDIDRPRGIGISTYLPSSIFPDFDFSYWQKPRLVGPQSFKPEERKIN